MSARADVAHEIELNAAKAAARGGPCPCERQTGCCDVVALGRVGCVRTQRVTCRVCGKRAIRREIMAEVE